MKRSLCLLLFVLIASPILALNRIPAESVPLSSRGTVLNYAQAYLSLSRALFAQSIAYRNFAQQNLVPGTPYYNADMALAAAAYDAAHANALAASLLSGLATDLGNLAGDTTFVSTLVFPTEQSVLGLLLDLNLYQLPDTSIRADVGEVQQVSFSLGDESNTWEITFYDSLGNDTELSLNADGTTMLDSTFESGGGWWGVVSPNPNGTTSITTSTGTIVLSAMGTCLVGCQVPGASVIFPDPDSVGGLCDNLGICGSPADPSLPNYEALAPEDSP